MFDLDAAMRSWRDSFGESLSHADLAELEEHLRSQIDALASSDLSQEEAFLIARRRIGRNGELETEYAKVNAGPIWIGRVQWMVLGFLGISSLLIGLRVVNGVTAWSASMFDIGAAGSLGAMALVQVLGLTTLVWVFFRVVRSPLFAGRRLLLWTLILALSVPVLMTVRGAISILQGRLMTPEEMGRVIVHQSMVANLVSLLFPVYLLVIVFVLERKRRTA